MLLSIVVNLSYTVNGTQSAPQAASPLVPHGGTSVLDTSTVKRRGGCPDSHWYASKNTVTIFALSSSCDKYVASP